MELSRSSMKFRLAFSLLRDSQTIFLYQQNPKIVKFPKNFQGTWIYTFDISTWKIPNCEPLLENNKRLRARNSRTNQSSPNL